MGDQMTYEEMYEILYTSKHDENARNRVRHEITRLSGEEWNDWIEYRNMRQGKGDKTR